MMNVASWLPPESKTPTDSPDRASSKPESDVCVEIDIVSDHHFWSGIGLNMSEGGVFIATHHVVPIGSRLRVQFGSTTAASQSKPLPRCVGFATSAQTARLLVSGFNSSTSTRRRSVASPTSSSADPRSCSRTDSRTGSRPEDNAESRKGGSRGELGSGWDQGVGVISVCRTAQSEAAT